MGKPKGWKPPPGWSHPNKGKPSNRGKSLAERFWMKVDKRGPDECWPWIASLDSKGYGQIYIGGKKNLMGHSVSMMLHGFELPEGKEWDHICKNTKCVNPKHLRAVTHLENCTTYSDSPLAKHKRKTECPQGHPYSPENTAIYKREPRVSSTGKKTGRVTCRICLTCYPSAWRQAIIPRNPPPRAKLKPHERQQYSENTDGR